MSFVVSLPDGLKDAALAMTLSALAVRLLLRAGRSLPLAAPNQRSLHDEPIPQIGGLAIWAGFVPIALWRGFELPGGWFWGLAWLAVVLISLEDDRVGVPQWLRLLVQVAAGSVATWAILPRATGLAWTSELAFLAATVGIVWSANAFNFMDGSDALAAVMAITGFGAYAAGASVAGVPASAYWALAAACVPFAIVNWPPARLFMGDNGAVALGFLAAVFGIGEWARGTWPGWFPLLVFLPFLADATLTLGQRALRRERLWVAHRHHYYQRLHRLGAGHRGTLRIYGALMAGTALSAVATLAIEPAAGWPVLMAWCVMLGILFLFIDYHWRRRALT